MTQPTPKYFEEVGTTKAENPKAQEHLTNQNMLEEVSPTEKTKIQDIQQI